MSYLINARQRAERAMRQKNLQKVADGAGELYPAVITDANGDGYDVATIDASGNIGRTYERVFPHPIDQTFEVDDEVWLWIPGDGETPLILAAGGGESGTSACYGNFFFGVLP